MWSYEAETSPEKRDPRVNNEFSRMEPSPPLKMKDAQQRPRAPFEPKRRTGEHSFPEGMPVHPLLTAKTPDALRKALMDPIDLGRPKAAQDSPNAPELPKSCTEAAWNLRMDCPRRAPKELLKSWQR